MPRNGRLQPRKKATFKSETTESRGAFTHFPSPPGMEHKRRCRSKRNLSALQHGWARCRLFAVSANSFERAVLRRLFSDCRGKIHLARHRGLRFKLSPENQRSGIAPDIAERKFNRARKRHRISVAPSPLCLQRLARRPCWRCLIEQEKRAFAVALGVKSQRTAFAGRKCDVHLPTANHARRLCAGQDGDAYLSNRHQD